MSNKKHKYRYMSKRKSQCDSYDYEKIRKINEFLNNHPELAGACSVKQRIENIKQPIGGYIKPSWFTKTSLDNCAEALNPDENIPPGIVGSTVDYLTRFLTGATVEDAFLISKKGAENVGKTRLLNDLLSKVCGLNDSSIIAAVRLSGFDVAYRAASYYKPVECLTPDQSTIENIRTMVERSLNFFYIFGPVIAGGLTFEGGYTKCIGSGDGDFLTDDTLWDFKVSKQGLQSKHTLQIFIYWRMGMHSIYREKYNNVRYLGVYNPRQNVVYRLNIDKIPEETIMAVDTKVIGYDSTADVALQ